MSALFGNQRKPGAKPARRGAMAVPRGAAAGPGPAPGAPAPAAKPAKPAPPAAARAERRPRARPSRRLVAALTVPPVLAVLAVAGMIAYGSYRDLPLGALAAPAPREKPAKAVAERDLAQLEKKLAGIAPKGVYITVDTVENKLRVMRGNETLRDALCSAGTGVVLEDPKSGKRWVFDSPRGVRKVLEKRKDPVWTMPDWAFIEEGEDLPKNWSDRIDKASLGDYALYLGDGYMIHGTLYQRYLGRNVTHGCIRLGDADLEYTYRNAPVGTLVFLY